MLEIRILGCSGGIGKNRKTTAFRIGKHILIDAGSGLSDLSQSELASIDDVFITHSHIDHIFALPLIVDAIGSSRDKPINIHCLPETEKSLKRHIFNNQIWPDLTKSFEPGGDIKINFSTIKLGKSIAVDNYIINPYPARHTTAAVGYAVRNGTNEIIFTGDTGPCPEFWLEILKTRACSGIIADVSFPDTLQDLAIKSGHMTAGLLKSMLEKNDFHSHIFVTHMKPGYETDILNDLEHHFPAKDITLLHDGMEINIGHLNA